LLHVKQNGAADFHLPRRFSVYGGEELRCVPAGDAQGGKHR